MTLQTLDSCCVICFSSDLLAVKGFELLTRVTSDSKPWAAGGRLAVCGCCGAVQKFIDGQWRDEVDQIYRDYSIYHQSGGSEQVIFGSSSASLATRSEHLVDVINNQISLGQDLSVLDFGCGTGSALQTFASKHPDWSLYGADLNAKNLEKLEIIPGFVELFTCSPREINQSFDLITAIHSLEHVTDPVSTLAALASLLTPQGYLLVQVPDSDSTPYDLVVADHLTHFTLDTLRVAAERAGLEILLVSDALLSKELTLLAKKRPQVESSYKHENPGNLRNSFKSLDSSSRHVKKGRDLAEAGVTWLSEQVETAKQLSSLCGKFGIFGSSISATWLDGAIANRADFFVDEDPARIGREHFGRPILSPLHVDADSDIYVPLIPGVATAVTSRYHSNARYHQPPPLRGIKP